MDYDPGDGAVPRPDYEDMSLQDGEDVLVTQETTRTIPLERISHVQKQQNEIASKNSEYPQLQYDKLDLQEQQEQIRR
ncbi:hypothetical protein PPTG_12994 [Phytophthora nicotianae INRA-310]|uniref:Uncharacterized protein n=1 Tax=Phytophthora nicotianae (strain INRA-310) TaxID=761204 RepID=W2Q3B5_PHYN3|nr:hypothetical protein PPTG_12994 [Phytophthora nicotianae INRA-310]ETN07652.1 hypothetical protein PPTG_12994 [Phytophthora nicotianae INRA-310]